MKFSEFYLCFHNPNEIWHSFSQAPIRNFLWCYNPWKMQKNNAIFFKLFWYKVFVHWKLELLNFLADSVLIFCILYFSQETLVCYHNPCHHGGTCVENPLAPCVCPNGYIGPHCEGNILGQILLWSNTKDPKVNKILYPIHLCLLTGTYAYKIARYSWISIIRTRWDFSKYSVVRIIENMNQVNETIGSLSKSLRRPLLLRPEVKKPRNDAVRMLGNDLSP